MLAFGTGDQLANLPFIPEGTGPVKGGFGFLR
jgi:hypothetical protein